MKSNDYIWAYLGNEMSLADAAKGYCKALDIYTPIVVTVENKQIPAYEHSFNCAINMLRN